MVPAAVVLLDEMPLTPNGKVDRKALPAPESMGRAEWERRYVAGARPSEVLLATLWRDVLGVEQIGITDNFFTLGGHSLLATQLVSRIRDAFHVELSLRTLFEAPVLESLAARITEALRSPAQRRLPSVVPVARHHAAGQAATAPLSFAQQRLWFLEQLMPGSTMYHIPVVLRIAGSLNITALERSLGEVVRRHEALRTTFGMVEEQPVQVIQCGRGALALVEIDRPQPGGGDEEREAMAGQRVMEAIRPLRLGGGASAASRLNTSCTPGYVRLLTMHHIVTDGWSLDVLVQEISTLFTRVSADCASPLPELDSAVCRLRAWQRSWLRRGARCASRLLRTQLGGAATLELATDRPSPAVQSCRGATPMWSLSAGLTSRCGS